MPRGGSAGGGKRGGVQFARPQEPSFLRKIKEQVGYKDPKEDLNAKRLLNQEGLENDQEELDDEGPTVVVLKEGDLTAEEAECLTNNLDKDSKESGPGDGKILFKKPSKRKSEKDSEKLPQNGESDSKKNKKEKIRKQSLLSFDDDEEEDT